jgi:adenosylmethionine-8-amino-7-oxononanoate aminotransferase
LNGDEQRSIDALEKLLTAGTVAAFIFEPLVQGAAGMRFLSANALSAQIALCRQHEVLTIADEVMTGFFRTGKFWACDSLTEKPDLFCIAKGLSGGVTPLAITTCTDALFEAFLSDDRAKAFFHGHSFTANPVGCAAGLASLTLLEASECQSRIRFIEKSQNAFCLEIREEFPMLQNPRALGTLFAAEVSETEPGYLSSLGPKLYRHFLENGVLLRPIGNTVYLMPPYCVTAEELTRFHDAIRSAARQFGGSAKL